jgi:hypothetical protein
METLHAALLDFLTLLDRIQERKWTFLTKKWKPGVKSNISRSNEGNSGGKMELDLQSLFGLHVHSCTHWLRPRNPLHHPAFGLIYEGAIGQPR